MWCNSGGVGLGLGWGGREMEGWMVGAGGREGVKKGLGMVCKVASNLSSLPLIISDLAFIINIKTRSHLI